MSKHTTPIVSITDELLAELEAAANAATPQNLDSAEEIIKADPDAMIECPVCCGEGYASIENDYCNFDNHAIGVEFYGIGTEFGAGERYFRAANPATILAMLAERAELKRDARRYQHMRASASSQWRNGPGLYWYLPRYIQGSLGEQLDQAIDAAMQETKP